MAPMAARIVAAAMQLAALWLAAAEDKDKDHSYDTLDGVDRYTRFDDHPKPADKDKAILGGGDVKCGVCEVILNDVIGSIRVSSDQDALLEALEADSISEEEVEGAATDMLKHVANKKRGCNRLFKDRFFLKGWDIYWDVKLMEGQGEMTPHWEKAVWAYVNYTGRVPNETEINTYSINREAAHYACENTVAKYRDELAGFISKRAKKLEGQKIKDMVAEACQKKAKCEARMPSEAIEKRSKKVEQGYKGRQMETMELFLKGEKEKKKAEKEAKKEAKRQEKKKKRKATAKKEAEKVQEVEL